MNDKPVVLIVDDVELNRAFLGDMLEGDYTIIEASNGLEAVDVLREYGTTIDIVLLDVVMPELDGFGVLDIMRQNHWIDNIPVVMISAENSTDYIAKGYELGAVDYINRPFDSSIIKKRIENTIVLYAKQKSLQRIVAEQIREKEKDNSLMIDILSTIVEFRNGESGLHVQRIRIITEILLDVLIHKYPGYGITPGMIAIISNAAALHDIGKVAIPEQILNKPGKLTNEEYEEMKKHTVLGAQMLDQMLFGKEEELVRYAHAICRWHHERWDGRGYPDGLKENEIPISAQIVSLADVYDALVSVRVYKPAYTHEEAVRMILNGECGQFNPDIIDCLLSQSESLEERIRMNSDAKSRVFDIDEISRDLIAQKSNNNLSDRTVFLLEQERTKYQFFAALSSEVLFEYDAKTDNVTFSEKGSAELGVDVLINGVSKNPEKLRVLDRKDLEDLEKKILNTTPEQPFLQLQYLVTLPENRRVWYEFTMRSMWTNDLTPIFTGFIGKMSNIHEQKIENFRLKEMAERDSLTGLYNHATAKKMIEEILRKNRDQIAALLFFDLDNFKLANDTYGHIFGDHILKFVAEIISQNIRHGDVAARIGGDEFLIFFKDVRDDVSMEEQAGRLCQALSSDYQSYHLSVSLGVAMYPQDGESYDVLLNNADQALYVSKKSGKHQHSFYDKKSCSEVFPSLISEVDKSE